MKGDTRSLSFTWIKGHAQKKRFHNEEEDEGEGNKKDKGPQSQEGTCSSSSSWGVERGNSGSRLRKLGSSLIRLGSGGSGANGYSSIEEDEENKWHQVREEAVSVDDEEEEDHDQEMRGEPIPMPDVIKKTGINAVNVPFQPVEDNVLNKTEQEQGLSLTKRLNKTMQGMKASFGNFSQKFRKSTRRRYRMPSTPGSLSSSPATRKILGRTPTKLYSPFGIESPITIKTPKRLVDRPSTPRVPRRSMVSSLVYSPSNNFSQELDEARRGMRDFHILSRDITRRSVRF